MSNRETYPSAQSPLQGDLSAPPGNTTVKVTGIQGIPVSPTTPVDLSNLTFNGDNNDWEPRVPEYTVALADVTGGKQIVSDDWDAYVAGVGMELLVGWTHGFAFQFFLNGTGVAGSNQ